VFLVCLRGLLAVVPFPNYVQYRKIGVDTVQDETYEWKSAVCAPADLGLVYVDEDPWVSERATASVTRYGTVVRPANGLLVDELDRGVWARLHNSLSAHVSSLYKRPPSSVVLVPSMIAIPKNSHIPDPP